MNIFEYNGRYIYSMKPKNSASCEFKSVDIKEDLNIIMRTLKGTD
jgi:hypothetical protein